MLASDHADTPHKIGIKIEKHFDGDTTHPPDEVFFAEQWFEGDGSEITDPARIAELEASVAPQETDHE